MELRIIIFGIVLFFGSCDIINPEEEPVAFIEVPSIEVVTGFEEGAPTEQLTHVFMFIDGINLGGFPLPARIPVIGPGEHDIVLSPAAEINGRSSRAGIYPFYETLEFVREYENLETQEINMVVGYKDEADIRYVEGFESTNSITVNLDPDSTTSVVRTQMESAAGSSAGLIELSPEHNVFRAATSTLIRDVKNDGSAVYIELDYKNDIPFSVGLVGVQGGTELVADFLGLSPQEDWNKVYIDITELIIQSGLSDFRILFTAVHQDENLASSQIFIDNIKFIHFE